MKILYPLLLGLTIFAISNTYAYAGNSNNVRHAGPNSGPFNSVTANTARDSTVRVNHSLYDAIPQKQLYQVTSRRHHGYRHGYRTRVYVYPGYRYYRGHPYGYRYYYYGRPGYGYRYYRGTRHGYYGHRHSYRYHRGYHKGHHRRHHRH